MLRRLRLAATTRRAGSKQLTFKLTDEGCSPTEATAPAGPIDFKVENGGTTKYSELEVVDGETILGERENITEGTQRQLLADPRRRRIHGPLRRIGGEGDGTLKVTGKLKTKASPEVEKAIAGYRTYLVENTDELTAKTKPFVAAVEAGDIAKAKRLYPEPRIDYERIEPVAESFGDLDPRIDARENDVEPSEFGGFHRLEKALWEEGSLTGHGAGRRRAAGRRRRTGSEGPGTSSCRRCRSPTAPTSS